MKKLFCVVLTLTLLLALAGCGSKTLHCDKCGTEVKTSNQNMEEDWIIYCAQCNETLEEQ